MAVTATDTTAIKLGGVTQIILTPYTDGTKGSTSYSLDNIVADTTSITQEEPTTNTVDCETRDEPIFENITLGRYTFSAESGDIQDIAIDEMSQKMVPYVSIPSDKRVEPHAFVCNLILNSESPIEAEAEKKAPRTEDEPKL